MKKSVALLVSSLSVFALCSNVEGMGASWRQQMGAAKAANAAKTQAVKHVLTSKSSEKDILAAIEKEADAVGDIKGEEAKKEAAYKIYSKLVDCLVKEEKYVGAGFALSRMSERCDDDALSDILSGLSDILWVKDQGHAGPGAD